MVDHLRARLRPEVLDDHLLDVPVAPVQRRDRLQGFQPFRPGLADPDQDSGGEGDGQLTGEPDRLQTRLGELVGRAVVGHAPLGETE
jgi:hypothetical protein